MKIFQQPHATYLIGTAVVWAALSVVTVVVFWGTPHFGEMLPILCVGAAWSLVTVPGTYLRKGEQPNAPRTLQEPEGVNHDSC